MEAHIQDPVSFVQHYGVLSTVTVEDRDCPSYLVVAGYRPRSQLSGPCVVIVFQESQQECSSGTAFHVHP